MFNRLMHRRSVVFPPFLLAFLCCLVWMPVAGSADSLEGRGPAIVLVIPPQKTAEVPGSVATNIEQNLKSLLEIDSTMKLLFSSQRDPGPDFVIPDSTPVSPEVRVKPVPENPKVKKALASLEKARKMVARRKYESSLNRLLSLQKQFSRLLKDMDGAQPLIDSLELTAVAFMSGGFYDEGNSAIRALLTVVPDYAGEGQSKRFKAAVARNRNRLKVGGNLIVKVSPDDAVVYVDGRLVGQGSQAIHGLYKGKHYIKVAGDTSFSRGGMVRVKSAGNNVRVSYDLKSRVETIAPPPPPPIKAGPRPLVWYGKSGLYDQSEFSADIKTATAAVFADNVLFTFIARADDMFHIGAFVGNGLNGSLVAVENVSVALDLSNLYVELLGLETRIQKAIQDPATGTVVAAQPAIYLMAQAKSEPVVVPAPAPEPTQVYVELAPAPAAQPASVVADQGMPDDFPIQLPADFPMADTAPAQQQAWDQPITTVVEETVVDEEPIHKKWWLWTIVGVVVVGAVAGGVAGYYLGSGSTADVGGTVGW